MSIFLVWPVPYLYHKAQKQVGFMRYPCLIVIVKHPYVCHEAVPKIPNRRLFLYVEVNIIFVCAHFCDSIKLIYNFISRSEFFISQKFLQPNIWQIIKPFYWRALKQLHESRN